MGRTLIREVEIHEQQQRKCISYYRPHENPDDLCVLSKDAAWSKQNCCGISLLSLAARHNLSGRFRKDFLGHLKSFLVFWVNTRVLYSFLQYSLVRANRACNFIGFEIRQNSFLSLIIECVFYSFLRTFGASYIQVRLIFESFL